MGQRIKKIIKKLSLLNISREGGSHKGNQLLIEILNISSVSHKQTVHACVFLSMLGSFETTSVVCLLRLLFEQKRVKHDAWLSIIKTSLKKKKIAVSGSKPVSNNSKTSLSEDNPNSTRHFKIKHAHRADLKPLNEKNWSCKVNKIIPKTTELFTLHTHLLYHKQINWSA